MAPRQVTHSGRSPLPPQNQTKINIIKCKFCIVSPRLQPDGHVSYPATFIAGPWRHYLHPGGSNCHPGTSPRAPELVWLSGVPIITVWGASAGPRSPRWPAPGSWVFTEPYLFMRWVSLEPINAPGCNLFLIGTKTWALGKIRGSLAWETLWSVFHLISWLPGRSRRKLGAIARGIFEIVFTRV